MQWLMLFRSGNFGLFSNTLFRRQTLFFFTLFLQLFLFTDPLADQQFQMLVVITNDLADVGKQVFVGRFDIIKQLQVCLVLITKLVGNDSNLLIVFYVQIMPDDFVMQLHRF